MPVGLYTGPKVYTGNGVTTVFAYDFRILEEADLLITVDGVTKTLTTDYTVSGEGDAGGGNVTFLVAPANLSAVVIDRQRAYLRDTDYQRNGAFDEETVDADFDSAEMQIQQLAAIVRRSFKGPRSVSTEQVLTEAMWEGRAGLFIGFDANGDIGVFDLASSGDLIVTAFIETLLDDADAATARTTLGAVGLTGNETIAGDKTFSGTVALTGGPLNTRKGADIASAGTINLTSATGNVVDVTGTTTITAITLGEGMRRLVRFTGALTLTNGASLVLPGGADIVTAAGDFAEFVGYASSVVRCANYVKATGAPIAPPALHGVLGADVALNNTSNFFDGPTVAQGALGTWLIIGKVTLQDTAGAANFRIKLYDGTTVFAQCVVSTSAAALLQTATIAAVVSASPLGSMRIAVRDETSTSGKIVFNHTGGSTDSDIRAIRIK